MEEVVEELEEGAEVEERVEEGVEEVEGMASSVRSVTTQHRMSPKSSEKSSEKASRTVRHISLKDSGQRMSGTALTGRNMSPQQNKAMAARGWVRIPVWPTVHG